jgi:hypothetical protein
MISYWPAEKFLLTPRFANDHLVTKAADAFRRRYRHCVIRLKRVKPPANGFYVFILNPRVKTTKANRQPFHQWPIRPIRAKR